MKAKNTSVNSLWSSAIAEELDRGPTDLVCLTPGSRNSPLAVAMQERENLLLHSHLDERSAGYFALGRARRTGSPTVVVCTSGTAGAELHPAVIEANHSSIPLLILTADRPPELQDSGANQTINQNELYGSSLRWFHQLSEPELIPRKLRQVRVTINRATSRSLENPPGPVHLNVPFRKPLEPGDKLDPSVESFTENHPLEAEGRPERPFSRVHVSRPKPDPDDRHELINLLRNAQRPMVHLGPHRPSQQRELDDFQTLGNKLNIPVLADPLSGQRQTSSGDHSLLARYEQFLPHLESLPVGGPDLLLRVGHPPRASHAFRAFCESTDARQILISGDRDWPEAEFRADRRLRMHPSVLTDCLLETWKENSPPASSHWTQAIRTLDAFCENILNDQLENSSRGTEIQVARTLFSGLDSERMLFVGNSTPVRDLVDYAPPISRSYSATANRGASGIDGQLATSAGLGSGTQSRVVSFLGDVSFYHDMNSLLAFKRHEIPAFVVVINNDGGGIFQRLPINEHDPPFERYIRTSHGMSFEATAQQFEFQYEQVSSTDELSTLYNSQGTKSRQILVEIPTDAQSNQDFREQISRTLDQKLKNFDPTRKEISR